MKQKKDKEQKDRDFERLVQEQRQTIYSVCYLFANDRQEADDLAQEVLIRAEYVGFGILILLMVVANLNDILRWLGYM